MSCNPHSRWYWNDWENDLALRLCSFAAQGLWMRMLCVCARSETVGYLLINGHPVGAPEIAVLTGHAVEEIEPLLAELEKFRVFSRNRKGCIYNRRMVRDARTAERNRMNGRKGGNPALMQHIDKKDEIESGLTPLLPLSPYTTESLYPDPSKERSGSLSRAPARPPEPPAIPPKINPKVEEYAFEGKVIKLSQADYEKWSENFWAYESRFDDELEAIDAKAQDWTPQDKARWFGKVAGWLRSGHDRLIASNREYYRQTYGYDRKLWGNGGSSHGAGHA